MKNILIACFSMAIFLIIVLVVDLLHEYPYETIKMKAEETARDGTKRSMTSLPDADVQKLKTNGNWDEFNKQFKGFKLEITDKPVKVWFEFKRNSVALIMTGLIAIIFLFVSNFRLWRNKGGGLLVFFLSILMVDFFYGLAIRGIFLPIELIQFITDEINRLNLLIDRSYTQLSDYANGYYVKWLFFGLPVIIFHVLFLLWNAVCINCVMKLRRR